MLKIWNFHLLRMIPKSGCRFGLKPIFDQKYPVIIYVYWQHGSVINTEIMIRFLAAALEKPVAVRNLYLQVGLRFADVA